MKIYAISDLHLSGGTHKPMDIFGSHWKGHYDTVKQFWLENITEEDYVLHCGDFCWAMKFEDAIPELNEFAKLPGKKILIRGNHDLWWTSLSKMCSAVDKSITFIQNDSILIEDDQKQKSIIICGTRGWAVPGSNDYSTHDEKIYKRETVRLKLSLESTKKIIPICKYANRELIVMLHYPPLPMYGDSFGAQTEINTVISDYNVNKVVFGHIHKPQHVKSIQFEKDNIQYFLSSCDMLDNYPITIY